MQNASLSFWKEDRASGFQDRDLGFSVEQGGEWCCEETKVVYESSVEVGESKEPLEFLDRLRLRPLPDCLDLPLVHVDTFWADDIAEVLDQDVVYVDYHGSTEELLEHLVHEAL